MSDAPKANKSKKNSNNNKSRRNTHVLRKRNPPKPNKPENVVYATAKTGIKALLKQCERYFNSDVKEFHIYCIGRAIERGLNLALQLTEKYPCEISINTSTITLTDDLEPLDDEGDYETQTRNNSMLRILVLKADSKISTIRTEQS